MRDAGSLLVRAGLIDSDALAQARADRSRAGGTLAEHLVLAGVVADDELTQFFRERLMVPRVSGERLRTVPERIIARIPAELAGELRVVPVALDSESSLTIAMSDPSDTHAVDELAFFTEHYVVRAVASQKQIAWCLDHYYGVATPLLTDGDSLPEGPVSKDFESEQTSPFLLSRPKRLSEAVRAERRRVVPPATAPPPTRERRASTPLEATLEDLEASEGMIEVPDRTDLDISPPIIDDTADSGIEEIEGPGYILVLDDDVETSDIHPHIELDADEPDSAVTQSLDDGSPFELAPRVGEVLVNVPSDRNIGGGPAVVLDDSLFMAPSAAKSLDADLHEPVSEDEEETGQVIRIDADEPAAVERIEPLEPEDIEIIEPSDGVVIETVERGTDSAPILLSEIKQAVAEAEAKAEKSKKEPEFEIAPVEDGDDIDEGHVVLLEMPKRVRRSTSLGVGAPANRAAKVLGLRTGRKSDSDAPVITDDRDNSAELPILDAPPSEPALPEPLEPLPSSPSSPSLGIEAAAVADLDEPVEDDGDGQNRLLDTLDALAAATHRDEIVAAVLDYLDHYCERVVFLALKSGALEPFQIRSSQPIETPESARLPLREVSLLRDIVDTRLPYRGPLEDEPSQRLLVSVFGELSSDGLALPVAVRGRVVGLLYGDGIDSALSGDNIGLVTRAAGRALERSLRHK